MDYLDLFYSWVRKIPNSFGSNMVFIRGNMDRFLVVPDQLMGPRPSCGHKRSSPTPSNTKGKRPCTKGDGVRGGSHAP